MTFIAGLLLAVFALSMMASPTALAQNAETIAPSSGKKADITLQPGVSKRLSAAMAASVLYDNGPLVNSPGTGADGADESVLQNISLGMSTLGFNQFPTAWRVADDFTVTEASWQIDRIQFYAYQTGSTTTSTMTSTTLRIWDGVPGDVGSNIVWGDASTDQLSSTSWSSMYRVTEDTGGNTDRPIMVNTVSVDTVLPAGTYWLDWQTDGSLGSGPFAPLITINGENTTGNGLQSGDGGTTYAPANDGGTGTQQGFPFVIIGEPFDLEVRKTTTDSEPQLGDIVDFTITVEVNNGTATGIVVEDELPDELGFVAALASQGNYDPGTGEWTIGSLLDGQTVTLVITTEVIDVDTGPISNTATATFNEQPDGNPDNDSDTVMLTIQSADLELRKTSSDNTPNLGDEFTFEIRVRHRGGIPATGIRVTDILPQGVTFISADGDYDPGSGIWQVGDLQRNQSAFLHITVRLETTERITNRADITFSSVPDPFPANNVALRTINGQAADLELNKRVAHLTQVNGVAIATYEVTVSNNGPRNAQSVLVSDLVSPNATIVPESISVTAGTFGQFENRVEWAVGNLNNRRSATLTMTVQADASTPIMNVAEVTSSSLPDPDSEPNDGEGDDFDSVVTGLRENPDFVGGFGPGGIIDRGGRRFSADLSLTKTVDNATPLLDSDIVYTITIHNDGPQATSNIKVRDVLPAGLMFVSSTPSQGFYNALTGIWEAEGLLVGSTATLEIMATVTGTGTITNTASIQGASLPDPDDFFTFFEEKPEVDDEASVSVTVQSASAKVDEHVDRVLLGTGYPNPFNPEAVIPFALPAASEVRLAVYDMLGRRVALLVEGRVAAGNHEVVFNGAQLPTGVYLVRLEVQGEVQTRRITLMK